MAGRHEIPSPLRGFIIDNIQLDKQIGRGANGRILEAKWEGATVAVKEIHSIFINEVSDLEFKTFKRSFLQECEQSSRLRHPNIVRFFGIYWPPNARAPSLVMERLHCSLTSLLEQNPVLPIDTKLSIIFGVALGLRYLHTRTPIIIHRDLSSNNVLVSKGMEGKIGDLGTVRFVDSTKQSRMTKAPGTVDFMPPEALAAGENVRYERELDVFSFGCVMLHTLSHQWPTPSEPVVTDPVTFEMKAKSEVERRSSYFNKIDRSRSGVLIPMIKNCLNNIPKNRTSIVTVCNQLDGLVDEYSSTDDIDLPLSALKQEIKKKDAEIRKKEDEICRKDAEIIERDMQIQNKDDQIQRQAIEIEALKSDMFKLQTHSLVPLKVNNSSIDFWNNLKLTWQQWPNLPMKYYVTCVAELDGKVYIGVGNNKDYCLDPLVYDSHLDKWSVLPSLPHARFSLVTVPHRKQLLAIGGVSHNIPSNKVFAWDENNRRWKTPYPDMPTARCCCSSISYEAGVIVVGGVSCPNPLTLTGAVEILHFSSWPWLAKSYWSVAEHLPYVIYEALLLIIDGNLYLGEGFDAKCESVCSVVTASLSELLQNGRKEARRDKVWHKLPDMPYSPWSITRYQGRLVIFNGDRKVREQGSAWELVQTSYQYNPHSNSWDYVGNYFHGYKLGKAVHLQENKILFVGGLTGTFMVGVDDDMVKTCSILTITPK